MQRIVVAAKAGADEPWLADAAANLAEQTGAAVSVVSVDGLDVEMGSTMPRSEYAGAGARARPTASPRGSARPAARSTRTRAPARSSPAS